MAPIAIPEVFASEIARREGEAGQAWLASLPGLIQRLCEDWHLEVEAPPSHGFWGLVFNVRGTEVPAVLKVSFPEPGQPLERVVRTLNLCKGHGSVRLLRFDLEHHALLLERLDTSTSLSTIPKAEALSVAGRLLRRLALPAPEDFPHLRDRTAQTLQTLESRWEKLGRPMHRRVLERAQHIARTYGPRAGSLVVNWDLHYDNVLAGAREPWLAVDPQVLSGDLEYAIGPLLWWPLEDIEAAGGVQWGLNRLIEAAQLDPERARAWTYLRTVDYWLIGLEHGLTIDPPRCQRVIEALDDQRWPDE